MLTLCTRRLTSAGNRRARCKSCLLTLLGFSIPFALMALLVLGALSQELLELALGRDGTQMLSLYLVSVYRLLAIGQCVHKAVRCKCRVSSHHQTPVVQVFDSLSASQQLYSCVGLVLLSFLLLIIARFSFRYEKQI